VDLVAAEVVAELAAVLAEAVELGQLLAELTGVGAMLAELAMVLLYRWPVDT
jgi:hypothetical protein